MLLTLLTENGPWFISLLAFVEYIEVNIRIGNLKVVKHLVTFLSRKAFSDLVSLIAESYQLIIICFIPDAMDLF